VDITPLLRFSVSESDNARPDPLEVDLTNENLGIGLLFPAPNIDNTIVLPGNRVEDAERINLSGGPADAVVGKLEANGFPLELELRHEVVVQVASNKQQATSKTLSTTSLAFFAGFGLWTSSRSVTSTAAGTALGVPRGNPQCW
jgi:hypothetical protein